MQQIRNMLEQLQYSERGGLLYRRTFLPAEDAALIARYEQELAVRGRAQDAVETILSRERFRFEPPRAVMEDTPILRGDEGEEWYEAPGIPEDILQREIALEEEKVVAGLEPAPIVRTPIAEFARPSSISRAMPGIMLAIVVLVGIIQTVLYFVDLDEQNRKQQELRDAEFSYEQKFYAKLLELGAESPPATFYQNHATGPGFTLPAPTEISPFWR